MNITRHYLTVHGRRVHYRKCGNGPPVLMVHQSPRSSAEYEPLMREWGEHFSCIAPDTPGFGQSDPLPIAEPDINDYADAIVEFVEALGAPKIAAYGFHSGGIILITALKRHPSIFSGVAAGGYAVWNDAERVAFGSNYTPPFLPLPYGEHLIWGWNRILEQSWFFPWYDARPETRLSSAHGDPMRVDAIMREILDAGDSFRLGYAAVLKAPRDIPPPDSVTPPVLITAYTADPLHTHLARLGEMPANWQAYGVDTPEEQHDASRDFLKANAAPALTSYPEDLSQGFVEIKTDQFDGLIHWQGDRSSGRLIVHAPASEAELLEGSGLRIDLPGHGLSSSWPSEPPTDWSSWQAVIDAAATHFGITSVTHEPLPKGDPDKLYPDLTPDRFGHYLVTAWAKARANHFFAPWYEAKAANAISFAASDIDLDVLARETRAIIRGNAAKALHLARLGRGV
jgi:haloalkane dehalogenase